ncbi:unnamed protein product [Polarella glacialis]|uniref:Uncharacterized protein n=1 Tax=Polarella glacialis TaxID=89957 RepID=A0A813LYS3_POLGL|nr:unnamed protein product [Polarella glacialis]
MPKQIARSNRIWRRNSKVLEEDVPQDVVDKHALTSEIYQGNAALPQHAFCCPAFSSDSASVVCTASTAASTADSEFEVDEVDEHRAALLIVDFCPEEWTNPSELKRHLLDGEWADPAEWKELAHVLRMAFEAWAQLLRRSSDRFTKFADRASSPSRLVGNSWRDTSPSQDESSGDQQLGDDRTSAISSLTGPSLSPPCRFQLHGPPNFLDRQIGMSLAASREVHERLVAAMQEVYKVLADLGINKCNIMLYGSLSFGRRKMASTNGIVGDDKPYVTNLSDVDVGFLVQDATGSSDVAACIIEKSSALGWRRVHSTVVPRFAVSQWTLQNEVGVHLDLTCIGDKAYFRQFSKRQHAFRELFWQMRQDMLSTYGGAGESAFDAYVYLLKAFAAFASRGVLTGFQAGCLGLFALQTWKVAEAQELPSARVEPRQLPSALALFNRFLRFCHCFFGGSAAEAEQCREEEDRQPSHRTHAIDLTGAGQLMNRLNDRARAEMYFAEVENGFVLPASAWMNVLHSLDPTSVSKKARLALDTWFATSDPFNAWNQIKQDIKPVMLARPTKACLILD